MTTFCINPRKAPSARDQACELAGYYADRDGAPWYVIRQAAGKYGETVRVERAKPKKRPPRLLEMLTIHPKDTTL